MRWICCSVLFSASRIGASSASMAFSRCSARWLRSGCAGRDARAPASGTLRCWSAATCPATLSKFERSRSMVCSSAACRSRSICSSVLTCARDHGELEVQRFALAPAAPRSRQHADQHADDQADQRCDDDSRAHSRSLRRRQDAADASCSSRPRRWLARRVLERVVGEAGDVFDAQLRGARPAASSDGLMKRS